MSLRAGVYAALLAAVGCGSLPQTHYYRLSPSALSGARAPVAGVLGIDTLDAAAAYGDDRIVYSTSANALDYYDYHRWVSPPAVHLGDYLRDALEQSGLFSRVVAGLQPSADAALSGRLVRFEEVDVSASQWLGRVELELYLDDAPGERTFWSRRFAESEPIGQHTPEGLAIALSSAMRRIATAAAPAIAEAMRAQRAAAASEGTAGDEQPAPNDPLPHH